MQKIKDLLSPQEFGGVITAVVSVGTLIMVFANYIRNKRTLYSRERLMFVFHPLFNLLEPYMKSKNPVKIDEQLITNILSIIDGHSLIAGGVLHEYKDLLSRKKMKLEKNIDNLIKYVNREYDKECKMQGIKVRRYLYRINTYKLRFVIIPIIIYCIKVLATFLSTSFILLFAYAFISAWLSVQIMEAQHFALLVVCLSGLIVFIIYLRDSTK